MPAEDAGRSAAMCRAMGQLYSIERPSAPRDSPAVAPMTDICPSSHAENTALMPSDGAPAGCTDAPCTCSQWLGPHQIRGKCREHRGARTSVQNVPHMHNERHDTRQPAGTPDGVEHSEKESGSPGVAGQRPSALRCRL